MSLFCTRTPAHVHAVESAHGEACVVRMRQLVERIEKLQMNVQQALFPQNLLRGLSMAMPFGCLYPRAFYGILRSSEAACLVQLRGRVFAGFLWRREAGCAAANAQQPPVLFHVCRARCKRDTALCTGKFASMHTMMERKSNGIWTGGTHRPSRRRSKRTTSPSAPCAPYQM